MSRSFMCALQATPTRAGRGAVRQAVRHMRLLFVCLGNICRSPTAEAVMRDLLAREGLEDVVEVDSAGTGGWHIGARPDRRSAAEARRRGIAMNSCARQVCAADFADFDLLLAMDRENHRELLALAPDARARSRVRMLRTFDPEAVASGDLDVPDPYYGEGDGFALVYDLVQAACRGLLEDLRPSLDRA
jgi:protein-tyrosine phosphatase